MFLFLFVQLLVRKISSDVFLYSSPALRMVVCNILIDMCFIVSVRKSEKFVIKVFQSCVNVIKGKFFFLKVVFRMV